MANRLYVRISDMPIAESLSEDTLLETAVPYTVDFESRAITTKTLGDTLIGEFEYDDLATQSSTIIGAINEIKQETRTDYLAANNPKGTGSLSMNIDNASTISNNVLAVGKVKVNPSDADQLIYNVDKSGNAIYAGDVTGTNLDGSKQISLRSIDHRLDTVPNYDSIEYVAEGFEFYWKHVKPSIAGHYDTGVAPFSVDNIHRDWEFELIVDEGSSVPGWGNYPSIFSINAYGNDQHKPTSLSLGSVTYWSWMQFKFNGANLGGSVWNSEKLPIRYRVTKVGSLIKYYAYYYPNATPFVDVQYTMTEEDFNTPTDSHLFIGCGHDMQNDANPAGWCTLNVKKASFMFFN